jgi:hypothetical protein
LAGLKFVSADRAVFTVTRVFWPTRIVRASDQVTEQQREVARGNVLEVLTEKYPGLSKYRGTEPAPNAKKFTIVNGVRRTYVSCIKTVDGEDILRGDFIVELDESTQELRWVLDAKWEAKP